MKCPECGNTSAKDVALLTSISYLCPNSDCRYYDVKHATDVLVSDDPGYRMFDFTDKTVDDLYSSIPPLFVDLVDLD